MTKLEIEFMKNSLIFIKKYSESDKFKIKNHTDCAHHVVLLHNKDLSAVDGMKTYKKGTMKEKDIKMLFGYHTKEVK